MSNKAIIIGIAGGSASGKTTIARKVCEAFKGKHNIVKIEFFK